MILQMSREAAAGQVDLAAGRIKGVKLLGRISKKGHEYSDKALQDVARQAEGVVVNIDHVDPGQRRSYRDRVGHLENVYVQEGAVYGDFVLNRKHELFDQIVEDAENHPRSLGFSIDAREGETKKIDGRQVVVSVGKLLSIDLVANPATTNGLWESGDDRGPSPFAPLHESKSIQAVRVRRTVERFTRPATAEPLSAIDSLAESIDQAPASIPPADASRFQKLARFMRK